MKKLSLSAGIAAIALAVASIIPAGGAYANTATYDGNNNTVTLSRTVSGVSNNVTNTFTYTIAEDSKPSGATVTGVPTSTTIAFSNAAPSGGSVTRTTTLNFANVNYSTVGDYIFTVSETNSSDTTNYPIDNGHNSYKIYASVRYEVDANNVPNMNSFVCTLTILDSDGDGKVAQASWSSGAAYTYVEATAKTTGNMADTNKCFAYTVNIPVAGNVLAGSVYDIDSSTTCTGNASSVTAGTPATIYLKHGDTVTIGKNGTTNQLPIGAGYTLTKTDTSDGYTTKMDNATKTTVTKTTVATTDANFNTNNKTPIENNKEESALTGIVTNFWFYLVLLIAGLVGVLYFLSRRNNKEEEQPQAQA